MGTWTSRSTVASRRTGPSPSAVTPAPTASLPAAACSPTPPSRRGATLCAPWPRRPRPGTSWPSPTKRTRGRPNRVPARSTLERNFKKGFSPPSWRGAALLSPWQAEVRPPPPPPTTPYSVFPTPRVKRARGAAPSSAPPRLSSPAAPPCSVPVLHLLLLLEVVAVPDRGPQGQDAEGQHVEHDVLLHSVRDGVPDLREVVPHDVLLEGAQGVDHLLQADAARDLPHPLPPPACKGSNPRSPVSALPPPPRQPLDR